MWKKSELILAFALALLTLSESCPDTSHCIGTHPRCVVEGINGDGCFKSIMYKLRGSTQTTVIFDNITISGLPGRAFESTGVITLIFMRYNIASLNLTAVSPFAGAASIKTLRFLQPQAPMVGWNFEHLKELQLTELTFSKAELKFDWTYYHLPENFKEAGTKFIKTLVLSASCLSGLDERSLSTFQNVETISLVGNQLTTIKRNVFPDSRYLKTIDLRFNQIRELNSGAFWNPNLPSLSEIFLQGNPLALIDESVYPRNAKKFYINGAQKLFCTMDLAWLPGLNDPSIWQEDRGLPVTCWIPISLRNCPLASLTAEELINGELNPDSKCKKVARK